jgi:hypothetical protein
LTASTEPTGDAELERLLEAYGRWKFDCGAESGCRRSNPALKAAILAGLTKGADEYRAALLAHINQQYVRRDRLVPDEWDNLDATAPLADEDDAAWRDWRAAIISGRVRHNRSDRVGQIIMTTEEGVDVAWDGTDTVVYYERYEAVDKLEPEGSDGTIDR